MVSLEMIVDLGGIWNLECAFDSKMIVDYVCKEVDVCHRFAPIIHDINVLLPKEWSTSLSYTYREGNQCANYLAKQGARQNDKLVLL